MSLIPRDFSDRIAFFVMLGAIHLITFFELLVILPYIDQDRTKTYWLHFTIGMCFYFDIMSNIGFILTIDTTSGSVIMPSVLKLGWRFCSTCEANAPPRSHHCWMCNKCILKRDHHCTFTGNCIGFSNQRYFLTFILHLTCAAIYCNYLNMDYTWEVLGGFNFKSVITMFVPLVAWMFGFAATYGFFVAFVSALCVIGCLLLSTFSVYHVNNLVHGQTTSEKTHKVHDYDLGLVGNIREVFGVKWYVAWVSPWISSPLPGDGVSFLTKQQHEAVKDM